MSAYEEFNNLKRAKSEDIVKAAFCVFNCQLFIGAYDLEMIESLIPLYNRDEQYEMSKAAKQLLDSINNNLN